MMWKIVKDQSGVPVTNMNRETGMFEFVYCRSGCKHCHGRGFNGLARGCADCLGTGKMPGTEDVECIACSGSGKGKTRNSGFRVFCRCLKFERDLQKIRESKEEYEREQATA